jgi:hypothetical protein
MQRRAGLHCKPESRCAVIQQRRNMLSPLQLARRRDGRSSGLYPAIMSSWMMNDPYAAGSSSLCQTPLPVACWRCSRRIDQKQKRGFRPSCHPCYLLQLSDSNLWLHSHMGTPHECRNLAIICDYIRSFQSSDAT